MKMHFPGIAVIAALSFGGGALVEVLWTDTSHGGAFVSEHPVPHLPNRNNRVDLYIGAEPALDRLLRLVAAWGIGFALGHA